MLSKIRTRYYRRYLLLEAFFWMGVARLVILAIPFNWIAPYLGKRMSETPVETLPEKQSRELARVAWAIHKMIPYCPWESKCLVQAIATKRMLQSRKIHSTLYLGVMFCKTDGSLRAHAWLRSGCNILTGARGRKQFTVVATFAENY